MEVKQYGLLEKLELPELSASYLQETQGGQKQAGDYCVEGVLAGYSNDLKDLHYPLQDVSFFFLLFAANSSSSRSVGGLPGGWD